MIQGVMCKKPSIFLFFFFSLFRSQVFVSWEGRERRSDRSDGELHGPAPQGSLSGDGRSLLCRCFLCRIQPNRRLLWSAATAPALWRAAETLLWSPRFLQEEAQNPCQDPSRVWSPPGSCRFLPLLSFDWRLLFLYKSSIVLFPHFFWDFGFFPFSLHFLDLGIDSVSIFIISIIHLRYGKVFVCHQELRFTKDEMMRKCSVALQYVNIQKNRYTDVLPCNYTD